MDIDFLREAVLYDKETGVITWKKRPLHHFKNTHGMNLWNSRYSGKIAGTTYHATNCIAYKRRKVVICNKPIMSHQIAWVLSNGDIPNGMFIDHIDGNALNNALINLRLVTHSENHRNRKIQSNNTSGVQGVRFIDKKWNARIKILGKEKSLGRFDNFEDAVNARREYAKEHGFTERHSKRGP